MIGERANGLPVYAVVKSDAYGHGAETVAHALQNRVAAFAVASVGEGVKLRIAGIGKSVLVLSPVWEEEELLRAAEYGLTLTVTSLAHLKRIADMPRRAAVHFAVNTGMNRFGFAGGALNEACRIAVAESIAVEGVYSHYYCPENGAERKRQHALFVRAADGVKAAFPGAVRHIAATGGILAGGFEHTDAVRPGIALYGYAPAAFAGRIALYPAMKAYAAVLHSAATLGGGLGYQAVSDVPSSHTLAAGYGDGFFRSGLAAAYGNLCMNAAVCCGRERVGKTVCVLGDAEEYARMHGTIVYEVLCRMGALEKVYERRDVGEENSGR